MRQVQEQQQAVGQSPLLPLACSESPRNRSLQPAEKDTDYQGLTQPNQTRTKVSGKVGPGALSQADALSSQNRDPHTATTRVTTAHHHHHQDLHCS